MVENVGLKQKEIAKRLAQLPPQKRSALLKLLKQEGVNPLQLPILPVDRQTSTFPLSWSQERLWFVDQLEGPSSTYNAQLPLRIAGSLDVVALQKTLDAIVQRHEILRTTFETVEGKPTQRIHKQSHWPLQVEDWSSSAAEPESALKTKIQAYARQQAEIPFDLTRLPLVRASLVQLAPNQAILLIDIHHIIWDAWSIGAFGQEFVRFYLAYSQHQTPALEPLSIQYADYTLWQRQWLQGESIEGQLSYWQQQLANAPTLLELPTDRPRPAIQRFYGSTHTVTLPWVLGERVKAFAQHHRVTLFMTLLTAFEILLYRYNGQPDITVGTPIANRQRGELEPLIGFFVNTLALRTQIAPRDSVLDLLQQVRRLTLEAYAHQDVPFEQVVEALQPERSLAHTPLFQVMFVLQNTPMPPLELPDVSLTLLETDIHTAKFDLTLEMEDTEQGLVGHWLYNTDLFEAATIERMATHFEVLLSAMVENDSCSVGMLPLLTKTEQTQVLQKWNQTTTDYPQTSIHELFEAQVARTPNAPAVIFGEHQLTYQELNAKANQLAHYLQSLGVGPEILVGLYVERSLDMVVGLLGILKAGGGYVPLDPSYPRARLEFMLQDAHISLLVTQAQLATTLSIPNIQTISMDTDWPAVAHFSSDNLHVPVSPDNLAYVIYTSGSTGQPKGVAIPHRGFVNYLSWCIQTYNVAEGNGTLVHSSIGFDATITGLFSPLLVGKPVFLVSPHQEIEALSQALQSHHQLSLVKLTPAHLALLSQLLPPDSLSGQTQALVIGGEALHEHHLAFWRNHAPTTRLINEYGPTETVVGCCVHEVTPTEKISGPIPIGRPIANTQLYVLDAHQNPVAIGVVGELYIGGAGVARGYLNRPELTAKKFIANPFGEGRLYRTGDLARYRKDGSLEYWGRVDTQVKLRGFRIELDEIEAVLSRHAQVQQCVVIVREDISGHQRLVAYVVRPSETEELEQAALKAYLKAQLPDYMVPGVIMSITALPMTPNGKVDRQALPEPEQRSGQSLEFVAPETELEQTLATIWQDILNLEKVSIQDNFFELGGDSILSIQMIAQARKAGLALSPKQLFQSQTIAELVTSIEQETATPILAQQGLVMGAVPLTPIQQWFLDQSWSNPHHFNQALLLQVPADLKVNELRQSLHQLVMHHDALRLRFVQESGQWQQFHGEAVEELLPLEGVDLSHLSEAEQRSKLTAIANQQQASLHLSHGPIGRAVLFQLGQQQRLLLILHHLVIDGVSWRILLGDLVDLYHQAVASQPLQLPAKTTAFQDWALQLQAYSQSSDLQNSLEYWLQRPWSRVSPLPVDIAVPSTTSCIAAMKTASVNLSNAETEQLLRQVPEAYNTQINDALLTALAQTIGTWSNNSAVLIHLEGHGRESLFDVIDVSRTMGWFTSLYPVLLTVTTNASIGDILKAVKEQLRAIPQAGMSYGLLRYMTQNPEIESALKALPTPEISFNYLGQIEQGSEIPGWSLAQEPIGNLYSSEGQPAHPLEINAQVVSGQLEITWGYDSTYYRPETIERLAQDYIRTLQALINHCLSPEAGGYTPSDFPTVSMTQTELDDVLDQLDL